ncbi:MAG: methyltransferase domain-containing protein [Chloracidobacterium sp.]|nr:methyltransferase domain-containing protein [Chloracidobacterium sp.]MCC6824421.1 methyltransferase domain-containing protein [Acidobacteriota bacterium]
MELVQRVEFIKSEANGRKVLHLGCTNHPYTQESIDQGMLLHNALEAAASEIYGFDYDQEGIDTLAANGSKNLYRADLEKLEEVDLDTTFDVIIAGEMIEHLSNPGLFLTGIQRFMHSGTRLVITTINAYCAMRFATYFLRGKGGTNEMVHPDHVAYYSYKTLSLVLQRAGLRVDDFKFYDLGIEHRPYNPWYLNLINDTAVRFSPQVADGVIAVCSLNSAVNDR